MSRSATRPVSLALATLVLVLGVAACATAAMSTAARDAMVRSSNCPIDEVKVEELGNSKYRTSGCQKTETYICKAAEHAVVSCVPESSVTPPPGQPR